MGVVPDESQPSLVGIGRSYRAAKLQLLLYRARRNADPEFQLQFVGDAFLAPGHILRLPSDGSNCRRFFGKPGLPVGFDFQRQNSRNPLRCQRMSVSARFRFGSASCGAQGWQRQAPEPIGRFYLSGCLAEDAHLCRVRLL